MKKIINLFLILTILVFSCKKNDTVRNNDVTEGLNEKLVTNLNVMHDAAVIYSKALQESNDSIVAFDSLRTWLSNHPDVSGGWFHNIEFLEIEFKNGLKSPITLIPVSNDGGHYRRGGGGDNNLKAMRLNKKSSQKIKNKKVLVLIPYPEEFKYSSTDIQNIGSLIQSGDPEMEADVKVGSNVKLSDLNTLGDYGLIILDVHGVKHGFSLAYLKKKFDLSDIWLPEDLIKDAFDVHSIPADKIASGEIEIELQIQTDRKGKVTFQFGVLITEDYIRQLNIDLSDAVVFGNHCYSGHTAEGNGDNNLPQAWKSKGAATYYGYAYDNQVSIPVDNGFCKDMEKLLINGLVVDGDSTGSAHLNSDGTSPFYDTKWGYTEKRAALLTPVKDKTPGKPLYLVQFFDKNYEYEGCSEDLVDDRDKKVYQTVCIGKQVWMAENLNWSGAGVCYDNSSSNCDSYGRLYSIKELTNFQTSTATKTVQGLCPKGWHVPSETEIDTLVAFCGGFNAAADKLRSTTGWPSNYSNKTGFNLKPAGHFTSDGSTSLFRNKGDAAYLWTSTKNSSGFYMALNAYDPNMRMGSFTGSGQEWYFSCRCLKDE